jgi:hypothetical protein
VLINANANPATNARKLIQRLENQIHVPWIEHN